MAQNEQNEQETKEDLSEIIDLQREEQIVNEFIATALGDKYDDIDDNNIEWTQHKTSDKDIVIESAYIKQANIMTVRSSVTVPVSCDDFYEFVNAKRDGIFEAIKACDDMNIEIFAVKRYDDDRCLVYSAFNAPVPKIVYPRDFCYLKSRKLCKGYKNTSHYLAVDVCYSVDSSFPHYVPLHKERVRGHLFMAGLLFEKIDEHTSRAYYVMQLDPKGWIPHWIVNLTAPQQGYNIKWVRDYLPTIQELKDKKDKNVKKEP